MKTDQRFILLKSNPDGYLKGFLAFLPLVDK